MAVHTAAGRDAHFKAGVPDLSQGFHDYGMLWGRSTIIWYFDGAEVARAATPADLHQPMYLLINLAVGGTWPGYPDASTRFPAEFKVDHVRAYATPDSLTRVGEAR
jgi:beta-glucanase (GH16 family)